MKKETRNLSEKTAQGKDQPDNGFTSGEDFPEGVTLTHPEKILFEESSITKGDVAQYYRKISERMLPYLQNRILSMVRCPRGAESGCYYRKHPGDTPGIAKMMVQGSEGMEEYGYLTDVRGMLSEVQMDTLEFHTWGSRVEDLEHPDTMVFDLDPDEGMDLQAVRQGARDVQNLLDEHALKSFLKTSGGKGYHIVVPLAPVSDWESVHRFAQDIAIRMAAAWPDRYTGEARKARRAGKIFVDWLRNTRGATTVAPYSLRAREGAPVSLPISWAELEKIAPKDISMADALNRLEQKDPWAGFWDTQQRLK